MSLVGRHIGRYRILEQVGQGGMSVVYKGLDTQLEREVAVKVLHAHLAAREESRRRLAREAKAVARLHHPNILEVYDFAGADADQAYIVTEFIRGQTLRHWAEAGGFEPPEIAAMVIHELASALAQAHEAGIIHRDLKPENVMVRDDGVLKLMDFGIAKIIDRDDGMTVTGALVGSPAHMAPEIIEGEDAGAEADIFSLGTMLYLFSTAQLPFSAPNTTATLKKILDGLYDDPRQRVPTVSDDLAEIIATCLARQPSSRYANAGRLRDALGEYLAPLGLGRTTEELSAFFADPPGYRKALVPRLSKALIERSEALIAQKRPAKALSALNQVLAHDPQNARALALLAKMNATRKRQRLSRAYVRAALIAGGAVIAAAAAPATWRALHPAARAPAPLPIAAAVTAAPPNPVPSPRAGAKADPVTPDPAPVKAALPEAPPGARPVKAIVERHPQKTPQLASALPVVVNLRPYGYLEVDGGQRSAELPHHPLTLSPGRHALRFGCRFCEDITETVTVSAGAHNEFHFQVEPLPAIVTFNFTPREAQVRLGTEVKRAADSLVKPFEVRSDRTSTDLRHRLEYEVFSPGYRPQKAQIILEPGERKTLSGALDPE